MPPVDISENVRQFIFSYIDSVEQLEVLLLLRSRPGEIFTARKVAEEMRSTDASVSIRLSSLVNAGMIEGDSTQGFKYLPKNEELTQVLTDLSEAYRVLRHRVLELIFSPMKKARNFANAFVVSKPKSEDENG